jgi:hypothetical protein
VRGPIVAQRSYSNGNAPVTICGTSAHGPASPATVTICGVHLGAGDNHWAKLV